MILILKKAIILIVFPTILNHQNKIKIIQNIKFKNGVPVEEYNQIDNMDSHKEIKIYPHAISVLNCLLTWPDILRNGMAMKSP